MAVSIAADSGEVYVTTSVERGRTDFHPWQLVGPDAETVRFTGPTSIRVNLADKTVSLVAVQTTGAHHLYTAPIPAGPATPLQFSGGPIG